ncbi:hypothetical protein N7474_010569 [Penicillium riverlandense]|uniref:uncharacterized protein n=1 Tax=Penicillium riverlandense TaxID=1903569 RepID=UPI002548C231|nr:uncharacterized protein N7474_010569 [Penicillium riverlandense]KAJ5806977.1 hypothetical protein N7474_010569 [Penicillium riverlandense]
MGRISINRDVESNRETTKTSCWRDWGPSVLPLDLLSLLFRKDLSPFFAFSSGSGHFAKPQGFKIVALVPVTNHERTEILDCYLQKNLVGNHGFLDEVVFIPQTNNTDSLDWVADIVEKTSAYSMSAAGNEEDWEVAKNNVMYIRIDGDVVFLEDQAIPTIVKTKLDNPDSLMVSANVVNEAAVASLHSHPGIALPYLPELYHVEQPSRSKSQLEHDWRASSLPRWEGPPSFKIEKGFSPPFLGHRWLIPSDPSSNRDPIAASVYTDTGPTLQDWTVGAQQHYSFLHHLEAGNLNRYKFPIWVEPTEPISQNFGCFWGNDAEELRDIFRRSDSGQDELLQKWVRPDGSRPRVAIDGKGLVSHYSSHQGAAGLDSTDLVERYRAYAQENVCLQMA